MSVIRIRAWSVAHGSRNPYKSREQAGIRLHGIAIDHPNRPGEHEVTTSRVASVSGRAVTVESGNVYLLEGDPEQGYRDWLAAHGLPYNAEQPIAVVSKLTPVGSAS